MHTQYVFVLGVIFVSVYGRVDVAFQSSESFWKLSSNRVVDALSVLLYTCPVSWSYYSETAWSACSNLLLFVNCAFQEGALAHLLLPRALVHHLLLARLTFSLLPALLPPSILLPTPSMWAAGKASCVTWGCLSILPVPEAICQPCRATEDWPTDPTAVSSQQVAAWPPPSLQTLSCPRGLPL